jgi:hypothetical protein
MSLSLHQGPLPVFESSVQLNAGAVHALPRQEVTRGWKGEALPASLRWVVALDPERLWFLGEFPVQKAPPKHRPGEFVEWLAEADDVLELYVRRADGCYQEWHISPDGAWWSMLFVDYRKRVAQPRMPEGVRVDVTAGEHSWVGVLSAPRSGLEVALDAAVHIQVSACIFSQGPGCFITSAGQPSYDPDFHDARSFRPVTFRSL